MRVRSIELRARRVLNPRVIRHRRGFAAASNFDALRRGNLIDVVEVQRHGIHVVRAERLHAQGKPAKGSTPVIFAEFHRAAYEPTRRCPARDLRSKCSPSAVRPAAAKNTRSPSAREPDSVSCSTCPSRTFTPNSSPSAMTASASVGPCFYRAFTPLPRPAGGGPVVDCFCSVAKGKAPTVIEPACRESREARPSVASVSKRGNPPAQYSLFGLQLVLHMRTRSCPRDAACAALRRRDNPCNETRCRHRQALRQRSLLSRRAHSPRLSGAVGVVSLRIRKAFRE